MSIALLFTIAASLFLLRRFLFARRHFAMMRRMLAFCRRAPLLIFTRSANMLCSIDVFAFDAFAITMPPPVVDADILITFLLRHYTPFFVTDFATRHAFIR